LGEFVKEAMQPAGYDVVLCRNCNRAEGPRIVAGAKLPPPLVAEDLRVGTNERVNASVDFGVTESGFLAAAYNGRGAYQKDGPFRNLRLIAKIEDPFYLLIAVKPESGITDLAQIKQRRMPVKILVSLSPQSEPLLEYYGLTKEALESWGGSLGNAMLLRNDEEMFDVIISDLATPANNPESAYWPRLTQKYDLKFLDLSEDLLKLLSNEKHGMIRVTAKWGLLRGVDRPIPTVARTGEAVFGRVDTPDQAAYDAAKAIDEHRSALNWYARPYSYNSQTVWKNFDVPLHPGAERYYREKGYLK
jgi:TRAP transporter TAXI family solute receptor